MFGETVIDTQMSLFDNPADLMGKRTGSGALRIHYPGDRPKYKWRYFLPKQLESMRSRTLPGIGQRVLEMLTF